MSSQAVYFNNPADITALQTNVSVLQTKVNVPVGTGPNSTPAQLINNLNSGVLNIGNWALTVDSTGNIIIT
jgi:hypothetical protein